MGWFTKKEEGKKGAKAAPEMKFPELPELPEFPTKDHKKEMKEEPKEELPHQLPSFPASPIGEKFSQSAIKEAVSTQPETSKKLGEFPSLEEEMGSIRKPRTFEIGGESPTTEEEPEPLPEPMLTPLEKAPPIKKAEPVYIRIDKFEESLKIFNKTKEKIAELQNILVDIKKVREEEQQELIGWEEEIQMVAGQIERVDKDIFSKIE